MRCKKHFSDGVGVCASCLRERLCSLIGGEFRRSSDQTSPAFPRSVSHRKSEYDPRRSNNLPEIRFFSNPQVDPTTTKKIKKQSKFHVISNLLFRSKSAKSAPPDPFSGLVYPAAGRRSNFHRGMSPEVDSDAESVSPVRFGCSPEPWKKTPRAGHVRARASPARGHVASGMGICLSPLMRPSPIRLWSGKSVGHTEAVCSGEVRSTVKPHLSTAPSFCSNRSRKLADFGKFYQNR